ncbi:hypothetical protein RHMOL_Rhmol05G0298700 [Rhododendron molle]|uniref:Uncharacterized protein n=1 Tax=Rhododendron molle TaxID=49168 RepID=A0ACC0NVS3_RHOML|nr:hypothetical protein RHMOL_Rhmol05G0298700 [Rhododendron molle]
MCSLKPCGQGNTFETLRFLTQTRGHVLEQCVYSVKPCGPVAGSDLPTNQVKQNGFRVKPKYNDETAKTHESYVERSHQFPGMELLIREFSFHELNANLLWPGTFSFAEWLVQQRSWVEGRCTIELGRHVHFHVPNASLLVLFELQPLDCLNFLYFIFPSVKFDEFEPQMVVTEFSYLFEYFHALIVFMTFLLLFGASGTGALAIFLRKSFQLDITTSDYDDQEIAENIAHNCRANGISPVLPHVKHSWGDAFPSAEPDWDLVIASDILLYVKQYANLIKTLSFLLKSYKPKANEADSKMISEQNGDKCLGLPYPAFLMSWRRRIGKEDESLFFNGCENAGLEVQHLGSRVYCIKPGATAKGTT